MHHCTILRAISSIVILMVAMTVAPQAQERTPITEGTNFVVAFMNMMPQSVERPLPEPLQIHLASRDTCLVYVRSIGIDSQMIDQTLIVLPDSVSRLSVPYPRYITREHGKVVGGGIKISSTAPITVSTAISWRGNSESLRHLPTTSWGTSYRTFNLYQDRYGNSAGYKYRPAQIVLIAEADSTTAEIRTTQPLKIGGPNVDSIGHLTYRVTLNAYQRVYLEWAVNEVLNKEWASDPTGTLITSNKPIAVLSGHVKGAIMRYPDVLPPTGMFAAEAHFVRNCIQDVMIPTAMAGTEFVTVPVRYTARKTGLGSPEYGIDDDRGDVVRFIACENNTELSVHRRDGSGFMKIASIDQGEVHTSSAVEDASLWRASKPVLCMQYGKSWALVPPYQTREQSDRILGQPTVECGLPMMQSVPSVDRWVDHGSWHAQNGMDNFINVVCRTADADAIVLDGEPLRSKYGDEIRQVTGTEYSCARIPVTVGDHVIRTSKVGVRFMAWTYGSLEGLTQGRTYGAPLGIDLSEPCSDTIVIVPDTVNSDCSNGVFAAMVNVRSGAKGCGRIQSVSLTQAKNMTFEEVPATGTAATSFVVRTIIRTMKASGTVRILTTAGTYQEISYNHLPSSYSISEQTVDYGYVPINEQRCTTLTIINESYDDTLEIAEIVTKPAQRVFTVTPSKASLPPRKSLDITICARPESTSMVIDTILMRSNCALTPLVECRIEGFKSPIISVSDVSWDVPSGDQWHTRSFEIANTGNDELVVYDATWTLDPTLTSHFRLESSLPSFPMVIDPNSGKTLQISFNPLKVTDMVARGEIVVSSNAPRSDSVAVLSAKTSPTSTVAEHGEQPLSVSPQPLNLSEHGVLTVFIKDAVNSVSIADPVGRVIYGSISDGPVRIPASAFPSAGMYVLLLETSEGVARIPVMCIE